MENKNLKINTEEWSYKQRMKSMNKDELVDYLMIKRKNNLLGLTILFFAIFALACGSFYMGMEYTKETMYDSSDIGNLAKEICKLNNDGEYTGAVINSEYSIIRCESKSIKINKKIRE